jgi:nitrogen fixation protein FixH
MLGLHASIWVVFALVASRNPTFAVEPDYYRKAINWDATQAIDRASKALGWTVDLETSPTAGESGDRRVSCRFKDREGNPIEGAQVELVAFPHARATERQTLLLADERGGLYAATAKMKRAGLWEFRLTVRRGPQTFTHVERREVP